MYYEYFGLKSAPFSIAPDPDFLFMTSRHQEALGHLYHAVKSDTGFVLLTGEVGTGKTTLCRCFLYDLPDNIELAFVINPFLSGLELLESICHELGIETGEQNNSPRALAELIHKRLLENHSRGLTTILLIDEAQQISEKVLELIRLLTNLETSKEKLLKVVLVGQPELNVILSKPELRQLEQRITARYHIHALNVKETGDYINYRLRIAGFMHAETLFTKAIIKRLHKMTAGIPRAINQLCDRALLGTYTESKQRVDKSILLNAYREMKGEQASRPKPVRPYLFALCLVLAVSIPAFWSLDWWYQPLSKTSPPLAATQPASEMLEEIQAGTQTDSSQVEQKTGSATEVQEKTAILPDSPVVQSPVQSPVQSLVKSPVVNTDNIQYLSYTRQTSALDDLVTWLGLPLSNELASCGLLESLQWRCEVQQAIDWDRFVSLNRPGILHLSIDGQKHYAVIVGVAGDRLQVLFNGVQYEMEKDRLLANWYGHLIFLWQPPTDFSRYIYFDSSPNSVNWLAAAFSTLDGQQERLARDEFNPLLKERVELFQRQHKLTLDGIAGMTTLLKINEALGVARTLDISAKEAASSSLNAPTLAEEV